MTNRTNPEELPGLVERLREQFSRVGFGLLAHEAADTLESLAAKCELLNDWVVEAQVRAHKWMEAHDKLAAGEPYDLPSPADVPSLATALERIAQPVFVAEPVGTPDSAWRVALNERIEIARKALSGGSEG